MCISKSELAKKIVDELISKDLINLNAADYPSVSKQVAEKVIYDELFDYFILDYDLVAD
jgi:hypothetical protein